ncbi:MAG: zinc ribbon domain-containing protein [Elusimicrobia bacterium]|nr:zinc ribbon domain-containing protein [Elusimicrobiota bacterium]
MADNPPERVACPDCGTQNSPRKSYCDQCGRELRGGSAREEGIPLTAIRTTGGLPAQPGRRPPVSSTRTTRRHLQDDGGLASTFLRNTGLLLIVAGVGFITWYLWNEHRRSSDPAIVVPGLAERYLGALNQQNYASAYEMLSDTAKAYCNPYEFAQLHQPAATWAALTLSRLEPDAAFVELEVRTGRKVRREHLAFVYERRRWAVAHNGKSLRRAQHALAGRDSDMALLEAQAAVEINPRDPLGRALLCEASLLRNLDQGRRECQVALELARDYPSNISPRSLDRLRALAAGDMP